MFLLTHIFPIVHFFHLVSRITLVEFIVSQLERFFVSQVVAELVANVSDLPIVATVIVALVVTCSIASMVAVALVVTDSIASMVAVTITVAFTVAEPIVFAVTVTIAIMACAIIRTLIARDLIIRRVCRDGGAER